MTITTTVGVGLVSATPAAAQTSPPPTGGLGYVIDLVGCVTAPDPATCVRQSVQNIVQAILRLLPFNLPTPASTPTGNAVTPSAPQVNAPTLNLPSRISTQLGSLPDALRTPPVADATAPLAPLRQLIPTPSRTTGLTNVAPKAALSKLATAKLPSTPTASKIRLLNIADTEAPSAGSPVSGGDVMLLLGLGLAGAAGVTAVTRRRAAATN